MATDLSGYDDTVSLETLTAYREYVLLPCLNACVRKGLINGQRRRLILDIDEKVQQIDALTPPPSEREGARLVSTAGGIKSGERLTSQKGSDINRVRILTKMRDLGIKGASMNFGDDTIVCSDDKDMVTKWFSEGFDNHGFIETLADDVSFLMKRIPEGYAYRTDGVKYNKQGTTERELQRTRSGRCDTDPARSVRWSPFTASVPSRDARSGWSLKIRYAIVGGRRFGGVVSRDGRHPTEGTGREGR
jgi:hypothetical protein